MARRLVAETRGLMALGPLAIGLLSMVSACSSFHPIEERRYKLLNRSNFAELWNRGAYWHAYDDQHSHTSPCTNVNAGNHPPAHCARVVTPPFFDWDGGKCPPTGENKATLTRPILPDDGRICLQGSLDPVLPCVDGMTPTCNDEGGDASNMWGAGVSLDFSADGQPWDAEGAGFSGMAFDLKIYPEQSAISLRVEMPVLLRSDMELPNNPLMRDDGSVIGTDGELYSDCRGVKPFPHAKHRPLVLRDAVDPASAETMIVSSKHPRGSPFWREGVETDPNWDPSPVNPGHNEFSWGEIKRPPPEKNSVPEHDQYTFEMKNMMGINFHIVVPQNESTTSASGFHFCIDHLALLQK
ncbi:MAG TPA: hypothetical protein VJV79_07450 [Polyangiaceae bacterium]|nr:hypothetical protein [Polyangiaceae bacterium]